MSDDVKPITSCKDVQEIVKVMSSVLMSERDMHLAAVDRIERALGIKDRTSELRKIGKSVIKSNNDSTT